MGPVLDRREDVGEGRVAVHPAGGRDPFGTVGDQRHPLQVVPGPRVTVDRERAEVVGGLGDRDDVLGASGDTTSLYPDEHLGAERAAAGHRVPLDRSRFAAASRREGDAHRAGHQEDHDTEDEEAFDHGGNLTEPGLS